MKAIIATSLLAATALARPSTLSKRFNIKSEDASTVSTSDVSILTYALILEHLEDNFYRNGLLNFTAADFAAQGFDATFYANLQEVAKDESTHVTFLTNALTAINANVPQECAYNFPYTDPKSFVALASILEGVGVSAYLGAAADIASPDYLTAAGSVLTIEARHNAYLRSHLNQSPFPASFDTPLDFDQVHSLAIGFFVSCPPTNPQLGVTAFPALHTTATGPVQSGQTITLTTGSYILTDPNGHTGGQLYGAFMTPTGPIIRPATAVTGGYSVVVPQGIGNGQTYVILSSCAEQVNDETTAAGPTILEVLN